MERYSRQDRLYATLALGTLLGAAACTASVTNSDDRSSDEPMDGLQGTDPPPPEILARCREGESMEPQALASAPSLKRLSRDQYTNALRDLAGESELPVLTHPDPAADGNVAPPSQLRVTRQVVLDTESNAWTVADKLLAKLDQALGCQLAQGGSCLDTALDHLALRFHRRPIDEEMRTRYRELFATVKDQAEDQAAAAVIAAFAQSPNFIYRWDAGRGDQVADGLRSLDSWQWADALALFLWRTTADEELLLRVQAGELDTAEARQEEVQRLLDDVRVERSTNTFVSQWLMLGGLDGVSKEEPDWKPSLSAEFLKDTEKVFAALMTEPGKRFSDLFSHHTAWVTKENAKFVGASEANVGEGAFLELGHQRTGLLTHNAFLTAHSKIKGSSPISRGATFNHQILCLTVPAPPDNLEIPPEPEVPAGTTARELLAEHRANPVCAGCHAYIDPPGLALEFWDGVGKYRETEGGHAIDPSGELLLSTEGEPQRFETPEEMFALVGDAAAAKRCFVGRWFVQSSGKHTEIGSEQCAVENVDAQLSQNEHGLRETLAAVVLHPGFSLRWEAAQ